MLEFDSGFGRFLLDLRREASYRRLTIGLALLVLLCSFSLAAFLGIGHPFGFSLFSVILLAWIWGWFGGLLVGLAVPVLAIPITVGFGGATEGMVVDTVVFAVISLMAGGAVGLLSALVGQVVSTRKELKALRGILPICGHCHRIRQGEEEWIRLEVYLTENSNSQLSHGICPSCLEEHYAGEFPDLVEEAQE